MSSEFPLGCELYFDTDPGALGPALEIFLRAGGIPEGYPVVMSRQVPPLIDVLEAIVSMPITYKLDSRYDFILENVKIKAFMIVSGELRQITQGQAGFPEISLLRPGAQRNFMSGAPVPISDITSVVTLNSGGSNNQYFPGNLTFAVPLGNIWRRGEDVVIQVDYPRGLAEEEVYPVAVKVAIQGRYVLGAAGSIHN